MPDNQDYEALRGLLEHPERWTEAQAETARTLRRAQADAVAGWHPKDSERIASMSQVVDQLDQAIRRYEDEVSRSAPDPPLGGRSGSR